MNNIFETNILNIIDIIKKRIKRAFLFIFIFIISALILTIFFKQLFFYFIILYMFVFILIIILSILFYIKQKHQKLLLTYKNNQQEVIDFINIILTHYRYNQHRFILRIYYKNIIKYYLNALEAIKKL